MACEATSNTGWGRFDFVGIKKGADPTFSATDLASLHRISVPCIDCSARMSHACVGSAHADSNQIPLATKARSLGRSNRRLASVVDRRLGSLPRILRRHGGQRGLG